MGDRYQHFLHRNLTGGTKVYASVKTCDDSSSCTFSKWESEGWLGKYQIKHVRVRWGTLMWS